MVINTCQKVAINGGTIDVLSVIYIGDGSIFVQLPVEGVELEYITEKTAFTCKTGG